MTDYVGFFLNSASTVIQYECIEISHSNFSKVYRLVRNATNGLTVTLEDALGEASFEYCPMRINQNSEEENLEYRLEIELGDVGEIIAQELDNLAGADPGFEEKPTFIYRSYRSDDLSGPMFGPITLEIAELNTAKDGARFEARAPLLSINQTGIVYTIDAFPTLKSFL